MTMDQIQKYRLKNAVETAFNLLIEEFKDDCKGDTASLARDDLKTVLAIIDGQPSIEPLVGWIHDYAPIFAGAAAGIEKLRAEAQKLGIVIDKEEG